MLVRVHIKARIKGISIQIDRRKCTVYFTVFGGLHGHQFDASRPKGRKLQANSDVTCSISRLARRHARQWGRKTSACHVIAWLVAKGREINTAVDRKYAWMDRQKAY